MERRCLGSSSRGQVTRSLRRSDGRRRNSRRQRIQVLTHWLEVLFAQTRRTEQRCGIEQPRRSRAHKIGVLRDVTWAHRNENLLKTDATYEGSTGWDSCVKEKAERWAFAQQLKAWRFGRLYAGVEQSYAGPTSNR